MLRQSQQQKLLQKLSPQQIQLMKLLQVPTMNLEERIKEEMEENPALEYGEDDTEKDDFDTDDDFDEDNDLTHDGAEKVDIDDFLRRDDDPADGGGDDNYTGGGGPGEDRVNDPLPVIVTFSDHMLEQLRLQEYDERTHKIAEQIIGSMDDDGYLRREPESIVDDLAFGQNIITSLDEVNELILRIQDYDPPGVCAWTLQECLILQLKRLNPQTKEIKMAMAVLDKFFNDFIKKHYEKIQRHYDLDDETFKNIVNVIVKLNPKPGSIFEVINKAETYVIPDFFVENNNGKLELTLNSKNAPELRISEGYKEMLKQYDKGGKKDKNAKDALVFLRQKMDSAKWFIDAIKQRQQTLMLTMHAILKFQEDFFLTGDDTHLKPMILKDISQMTNLDISTLSRVANSKFAQTEYGTFKLKYFFSEGLATEDGEEVSTREVKSILNDLISKEDKHNPISDDHLTEMLLEKGYTIARRTVAKYREHLNIPIARLRKQL